MSGKWRTDEYERIECLWASRRIYQGDLRWNGCSPFSTTMAARRNVTQEIDPCFGLALPRGTAARAVNNLDRSGGRGVTLGERNVLWNVLWEPRMGMHQRGNVCMENTISVRWLICFSAMACIDNLSSIV